MREFRGLAVVPALLWLAALLCVPASASAHEGHAHSDSSGAQLADEHESDDVVIAELLP